MSAAVVNMVQQQSSQFEQEKKKEYQLKQRDKIKMLQNMKNTSLGEMQDKLFKSKVKAQESPNDDIREVSAELEATKQSSWFSQPKVKLNHQLKSNKTGESRGIEFHKKSMTREQYCEFKKKEQIEE